MDAVACRRVEMGQARGKCGCLSGVKQLYCIVFYFIIVAIVATARLRGRSVVVCLRGRPEKVFELIGNNWNELGRGSEGGRLRYTGPSERYDFEIFSAGLRVEDSGCIRTADRWFSQVRLQSCRERYFGALRCPHRCALRCTSLSGCRTTVYCIAQSTQLSCADAAQSDQLSTGTRPTVTHCIAAESRDSYPVQDTSSTIIMRIQRLLIPVCSKYCYCTVMKYTSPRFQQDACAQLDLTPTTPTRAPSTLSTSESRSALGSPARRAA